MPLYSLNIWNAPKLTAALKKRAATKKVTPKRKAGTKKAAAPKKKSKKEKTKKDTNAPKPKPKPYLSAFHLFRIFNGVTNDRQDPSFDREELCVVSTNFKALTAAERAYWDDKAAADKTRYFAELAAYKSEA
ncbi:hypothetical protein ACHAWC_002641 [Mediolabrus comicus]